MGASVMGIRYGRYASGGEAWLYLLAMLEFQSSTDPHMAVRALVYNGLLYQDLIRRGALDDAGLLPPVLPIVLCNGQDRWSAPVEARDLIAPMGEALARYQPSQRYFLLDERRWEDDDLPRRNLVSAPAGLENSGTASALWGMVEALSGWLRESGDEELAEQAREWTEQWFREGRERGLEQGREQGLEPGLERGRVEERMLLCRQASQKFGAETGKRLPGLLARLTDPERLAEVGGWIIECGTGAELLERTGRLTRPS